MAQQTARSAPAPGRFFGLGEEVGNDVAKAHQRQMTPMTNEPIRRHVSVFSARPKRLIDLAHNVQNQFDRRVGRLTKGNSIASHFIFFWTGSQLNKASCPEPIIRDIIVKTPVGEEGRTKLAHSREELKEMLGCRAAIHVLNIDIKTAIGKKAFYSKRERAQIRVSRHCKRILGNFSKRHIRQMGNSLLDHR